MVFKLQNRLSEFVRMKNLLKCGFHASLAETQIQLIWVKAQKSLSIEQFLRNMYLENHTLINITLNTAINKIRTYSEIIISHASSS